MLKQSTGALPPNPLDCLVMRKPFFSYRATADRFSERTSRVISSFPYFLISAVISADPMCLFLSIYADDHGKWIVLEEIERTLLEERRKKKQEIRSTPEVKTEDDPEGEIIESKPLSRIKNGRCTLIS